MKLSVSMIVKNEESCLRDCLESIKDADEIVIVDTGSTDKTIEIAKEYTDKVYSGKYYAWRDNFAFSRNQSLERCTGDWIIIIDADEIMEKGGIKKIRRFLAKVPENKKGIMINTISNLTEGTHNKNVRIFKNNSGISWSGAAHNYLSVTQSETIDMDLTIKYGFSAAHNLDPDRTFRILKNYVKKHPNASREKYYLAREYYYRKEIENALRYFDEYLKISQSPPEIADAYMLAGYCFFNSGNFQSARECCIKAIMMNPDFKEPFILMSRLGGSEEHNKKWLQFSELCTNKDVLFVRTAQFVPIKKTRKEKDSKYYDNIFKSTYSMKRYLDIFKKISSWVGDKSVLDIGCGTGDLAKYIKNYQGFDFSEEAIKKAKKITPNVWVGNAYHKKNYKKADIYVMTEVLEHLNDIEVLKNIEKGQQIIFSVPSFHDESHLRVYTQTMMKSRYHQLLKIDEIARFNWTGKWQENQINTSQFILLVKATKK